MNRLEIRGLAKTFVLHNQASIRLPVLSQVNLDVAAGECVALDGPSGAGKSTLLKCVYGTYRVTEGRVLVAAGEAAVDVATAPPRELLRLRREVVGYVSQFLRAIPRVPTLDVVAEPLLESLGYSAQALAEARYGAEQLLLRLRVPMRLWSVPPATFSGGEQQRVNIARGLARRRPLLLLDEPTASLDPANRETVVAMIREACAAGVAVVGIFHDTRVRESVATRTVGLGEPQ